VTDVEIKKRILEISRKEENKVEESILEGKEEIP